MHAVTDAPRPLVPRSTPPDNILDDPSLPARTFCVSRATSLTAVVPLGQLSASHALIIPSKEAHRNSPCSESIAKLLGSGDLDIHELIAFVSKVVDVLRKESGRPDAKPLIFESYRWPTVRTTERIPTLHVLLVQDAPKISASLFSHFQERMSGLARTEDAPLSWFAPYHYGIEDFGKDGREYDFLQIDRAAWIGARNANTSGEMRKLVWDILRTSGEETASSFLWRSGTQVSLATERALRLREACAYSS